MKNKINIINLFLLGFVLLLSTLIFNHKNIDLTFLNDLFLSMTNHMNINNDKKEVSNTNNLMKINEYTYTNDTNCIYSPFKATVIDKSESHIVLKCENNYYAYIENIFNVTVNKLDYIDNDDILANFNEYYIMYFYKEGIKYSYEEIFQNY